MSHQDKVIAYYKNWESRLGYTFFTWDTKHFGYYRSKKRDIPERQAQYEMMDLLAKKLELKSGDIVLDAGSGRGTTSCYLAQHYGASLVGIDLVDFEVKMAQARAKNLGLVDKVLFTLGDYTETKFAAERFEKVFTLETLVHSPDVDKTLKEFYRILKPHGKLVLFEYTRSRPGVFNEWENKMIHIISEGSAMASFDNMYHDEFVNNITSAGYKVISDEDITQNMLPSLERFYGYASIPYKIIKFFGLQKYFINTTSGVEFYKMMKNGLIKYRVFVAEKQ